LRLWIGSKNRRCNGFGVRADLFELRQQMEIRLDGDCSIKRACESLGHFSVSSAGIDKNVPVKQTIDEFLEETFGIPFLIGVIKKGLERPLVSLALRVETCIDSDFITLSSFLLILIS